jgi:glycosyltransferase involved in cell wall biosynthesis
MPTIEEIQKKQQLKEIKKTFNWKHYIYLNPTLKEHNNNDYRAWYHFKTFGFIQGLPYKLDNNNTNKVLVVMPTYNRANKIEGVIKMITEQYFSNWFFLIIDDGSNEPNKLQYNNIKQKYSNNDKILFLENETNCHVAKTLNKGIDYLLANYFTHFTWISDDNEYYPEFLITLINGNTYFNYSSFNIKTLKNTIQIKKFEYNNYEHLINAWGGCASFMWTKKAIEEIGYYDETVPCCEDYEYLIRTFKINSDICNFIDISLMCYILHKESLFENNKANINILKNNIKNRYLNNIEETN